MGFVDMVNEHVVLKQHLDAYLHGGQEHARHLPSLDELRHDDHCALGQWLYENLDVRQDDPNFLNVLHLHAEFHGAMADAIECFTAGDHSSALALFEETVAPVAVKVTRALAKLSLKEAA